MVHNVHRVLVFANFLYKKTYLAGLFSYWANCFVLLFLTKRVPLFEMNCDNHLGVRWQCYLTISSYSSVKFLVE